MLNERAKAAPASSSSHRRRGGGGEASVVSPVVVVACGFTLYLLAVFGQVFFSYTVLTTVLQVQLAGGAEK